MAGLDTGQMPNCTNNALVASDGGYSDLLT